VGTSGAPLHGPRGMFITGDTLWVADAGGLHGFHRRSGNQLAFVDFIHLDPGFLNDIARGADQALYITDTGRNRIYRMLGAAVTTAVQDTALGSPNGITWDQSRQRFVVAPWEGNVVHTWRPGGPVETVGSLRVNRCDGVEMVAADILIACQADSSLYLMRNGTAERITRLPGRPADIGVDTRRNRVAIPYIALNRVDILALPGAGTP